MNMDGAKKIVVTIDPLGNPKVEAKNFHGQGCAAATKGIEDALKGAGGMSRVMKPEWHQVEDAGQQEQAVQW